MSVRMLGTIKFGVSYNDGQPADKGLINHMYNVEVGIIRVVYIGVALNEILYNLCTVLTLNDRTRPYKSY